ncbi:MAG TPA: glycosyltransferase family 39 protein [Myxococcota bacterium]|nr:glycosyltransferase family 39 protein [Myxococcota bacterium]
MNRTLVGLVLVVLCAGLFLRDAWPPDETRYADVARAMSAGEGAIVPRLHGEVYGEKPPLFFWASAAVGELGVPVGLAPRVVSLLAAAATLALLPRLGRGLGLETETASRGALVLATAPLFLAYAHVGMLDATSTALVCAAIAAKVARAERRGPARAALVGAEGLVLGAALLTKGPVLLLFPLGARVGAWLGERRRSSSGPERPAAALDASDLVALGVALAVAGSWLAAAACVEGASYVRAITLGQAVRRMTGDAPHLRPPGYLLLVTAAGLLPWTLLGVGRPPASPSDSAPRTMAGRAALLGWIVLPLVLLSLLRTQQPHYLLPVLPAAALLLAERVEGAPRRAVRAAAALGVLLGAGLLAVPFALARVGARHERDALVAFVAHDPAIAAGAVCAGLLLLLVTLWPAPPRLRLAPWQRAAAACVGLLALGLLALHRLDAFMSPRALLAAPSVRDARAFEAPSSVRSAVRLLAGGAEVEVLAERSVRDRLLADPGRVALVWEGDVPALGLGHDAVGEVARGYARGRVLVALRAVPIPSASPERVSRPPASR